ncbi:uncharacterized protein LOC128260739 [Drosophila gunungcola]|uniref:uncharacterized protein LOC128260739 n=1 Tax=Drosophila gunungcola TaxID=103775 RepID=UPI0022E83D7C|nr:uncharacterized protein LOC128260739 [Drosophila gunungcola]
MLMSKWKAKDLEEIAVSVTLAHMAQVDSKLARLICTTNVKTRNELQQQLQAHSFMKRSIEDDATGSDRKKFQSPSLVKCNYCGKVGHKYAECRARLQQGKSKGKTYSGTNTTGVKDRSGVKCFKCGEIGHFASACPKVRSGGCERIFEKRVDICAVAPPSGTIKASGESVPFCFDSGAECSLVKESVAHKFKGKRVNNVVKLNGISNDAIYSTQQVLCNINIEQYCFEILLHVILDKYLKYDVLVGREILSQGFGVMIDADKFQIYKTKMIDKVITRIL